jgi:plastocyanin
MGRATCLLLGIAISAVGVAGCGGSSSSSTSSSPSSAATSSTSTASAASSSAPASGGAAASGGAQTLHLAAATSQLVFNVKALKAKAGTVTLSMSNPSTLAHGVAIQGHGVNATGKIVSQGGVSAVTAKLAPGTYTFYCPVPGHRQAGMQGTLVVT